VHGLDERLRVEHGVEEQVAALMYDERYRPPGKKLHNVGGTVHVRLSLICPNFLR